MATTNDDNDDKNNDTDDDDDDDDIIDQKTHTIEDIDKALQKYYKRLGHEKNYISTNGPGGKFQLFCDDNGFEDDDIADEIQAGPNDCTLVEFDMDVNTNKNLFPLEISNANINDTARNSAIYDVIKYCYENGVPPATALFEINTIDFNIKPDVLQKGQDIYQQQLKTLGAIASKEPALMHFFAVGLANNLQLLSLVVDSYTTDKTKHFLEFKESLEVTKWCRDNRNGFFNFVRGGDKKRADFLENAIKSYCNRIMAGLQFQPLHKVDDDIRELVSYIVAIPKFVKVLTGKHNAIPPFQLDLLVAVRKVKDCSNFVDAVSDDDDDDDDQKLDPNFDYLGDVQQKLAGVPVGYFPRDNFEIDEYKQQVDALTRYYTQKYQGFRSYLHQQSKSGGNPNGPNNPNDPNDPGGDDNKNNNDPKNPNNSAKKPKIQTNNDKYSQLLDTSFHAKSYPSNRRFCIFVDRRNPNNLDDKKDEMTFFEPPANCRTLPPDHVAEWFFESTRQCLIPRKDYTGNMTLEAEHAKDANENNKTITSIDGICGQLMTFSFHIETSDVIKCYIIWNGQTMRFHGDYLTRVLPLLFIDSVAKTQFVKDTQTKDIEQQFTKDTTDKVFDQFYAKAKIQ